MADVPKQYYNQAGDKKIEIKSKWWLEPREMVHAHVFGVVKNIEERQQYRYDEYLRYARLYANQEILGLLAGQFSRQVNSLNLQNRVTLNVVKACIDTVSSKIGAEKPRVLFLTEDGNWSKSQRAKDLTKYLDGWFQEQEAYDNGAFSFRDSCVFGTGGVKLFEDPSGEQIACERAFIPEIIVDDVEGMYGKPRQLHQKKNMFREVLKDMFGDVSQKEDRTAIDMATSSMDSHDSESSADMIPVIESWHLPSGPDAKDGRHVISIENRTLLDEPWEKPYFPFVFRRWSKRLLGFYGQGLAEELIGIQIEINKLLRVVQETHHLVVRPQVWIEETSRVPDSHINNQVGGVKRYRGQPPHFFTPPGLPPEIYNHIETLYRRAFEITGVSLLSATSQKPAGITAGIALQTLQDVESERFALTEEDNQNFYMQIADRVIDMTAELQKKNKKLMVKTKSKNAMEAIKWSDVALDKKDYILRRYPTNILPSTPAGKLQRIQEMMQAGFLDQTDAQALLDYPDLKQVTNLKTAPREIVFKFIENMLEGKPYAPPEPYFDLTYAKQATQLSYLQAKMGGAPEDRLEALRTFMDDIDTLVDEAKGQAPGAPAQDPAALLAAAQGQGAPMDQGAPPLAQPEAPPTSDLLPVETAQPQMQ